MAGLRGSGRQSSLTREVNDEVFMVASKALGVFVSPERLEAGAVYPSQNDLREVSFKIACAVVKYASDAHLGRKVPDDKIEGIVRNAMWYPDYTPVVRE